MPRKSVLLPLFCFLGAETEESASVSGSGVGRSGHGPGSSSQSPAKLLRAPKLVFMKSRRSSFLKASEERCSAVVAASAASERGGISDQKVAGITKWWCPEELFSW